MLEQRREWNNGAGNVNACERYSKPPRWKAGLSSGSLMNRKEESVAAVE